MQLSLLLLGPLEMECEGVPVMFSTNSARALLSYLAAEAGQAHSRESLAALLWPDRPQARAYGNLRQTLARIREALPDPAALSVLEITGQTIKFRADAATLDLARFETLLAESAAHAPTHDPAEVAACPACIARLEQAVTLYRGEFLQGLFPAGNEAFDEWLLFKREALHRQALRALHTLTLYHEAAGDYNRMQACAARLLALEPWSEEAHMQMMRALALSGDRSAALAHYETCRRVLATELGIEPAVDTRALVERIRAGEFTRAVDAAQLHNLPASLTPFVGRDTELAELIALCNTPGVRLLTLVGMGGVGKTRLAVQAASKQVGTFRDGVWFVSLATVDTPERMVSAIAQAIGLQYRATEGPEAHLLDFLRNKEMLLMLDNFEHLVAVGADLLLSILSTAPRTTILATSRERIGLLAEYLFDISGLSVPPANDGPEGYATATDDTPASLMQFSAVHLFVERARQVQSHFALSSENAQGVLDICRLVGGLPLGIVLAAAWMRHVPPAAIAQSIRDNLDFLASTARDASPQHTSLRAAFNHSWKMLSEQERRALRRLTVFRGGWEETAATVAGASLPTLLSLVDKSLLWRDEAGHFDTHEVLRRYAGEQLDREPCEKYEAQARHAAYFLDLSEQATEELRGPDPNAWLRRLDREHDNFRTALAWNGAADAEQDNGGGQIAVADLRVRMAGALWRFWYMRGYYREGYEHLTNALSTARHAEPEDGYLARAYRGAGAMAVLLGDSVTATPLLEESLRLYRQVGDKAGSASALNIIALLAHEQGDYTRAGEMYGESLAINRQIGDKLGILLVLNNWGNVAREQGDYERAQLLFGESLTIGQEIGDNRGIALSLSSMGIVAWYREDYLAATSLLQESLRLHHHLGDKLGISNCLVMLGRAAASQGQAARAARLWGGAEVLRDAIGSPLPPADRADHDCSVADARGQLGSEALETAWAEGRAMPLEHIVAYALEELNIG